MIRLAYIILLGLAALGVYLSLIPFYVGHVAGNGKGPLDPRLFAREKLIKRGAILARDGQPLALSEQVNGAQYVRRYPLGSAAANITGYYSQRYGSAGLEKSQARVLLGLDGANPLTGLLDRVLNRPGKGNDVLLTIDADLQKYSYQLLRGKVGAVVVLNPTTGAVLAMASSPSYDPAEDIGLYLNRPGSPLLNRAAQGAYPPGSIFKIVTAAGMLQSKPAILTQNIDCTGSLTVQGFILHDNGVHGKVDFNQAFIKSCNVAFAQYGLAQGAQVFYRQALDFGLTKEFSFPLLIYPGHLAKPEEMSESELASSAIGQGQVLISPLQAALLACAVANDGVIMKPYLISGYQTPAGQVRHMQPAVWLRPMDQTMAAAIKQNMVDVVRAGTGKSASLPGVTVAGKTGTAENPHGQAHAWFVGFAPAEAPRVAVAVLIENAGAGSGNAAPLARDVLRRALELGDGA
ncbi:MAG: penicillin-binding protein 2 [Firmicutes bacterium]|nr:penicillin-binding protein 2 [Bacillota bacterium]